MHSKERAPRIKLKLSAEEKAEKLAAMPEPAYTYEALVHGQLVTVKRYDAVKPDPDADLTDEEIEARDEAELLRLHHMFNPRPVESPEEYVEGGPIDGRRNWEDFE